MAKRKNSTKKRCIFPDEFKAKVVALVRDGRQSNSKVARNLDVSDTSFWGWVAKAKLGKKNEFCSSNDSELKRLCAENKWHRQDVDILAKATAFFAKEST